MSQTSSTMGAFVRSRSGALSCFDGDGDTRGAASRVFGGSAGAAAASSSTTWSPRRFSAKAGLGDRRRASDDAGGHAGDVARRGSGGPSLRGDAGGLRPAGAARRARAGICGGGAGDRADAEGDRAAAEGDRAAAGRGRRGGDRGRADRGAARRAGRPLAALPAALRAERPLRADARESLDAARDATDASEP